MPIAKFEQVQRDDLRGTDHYRVTPAPGARIEGTFSVALSMKITEWWEEGDTRRQHSLLPELYFTLAPNLLNEQGGTLYEEGSSVHEPFRVNGKDYGGSGTAYVRFEPKAQIGDRGDAFPAATFEGVEGYLRASFSYTGLSDAARAVVGKTIEAIAADYLTEERWLRYQIAKADEVVEKARTEVHKAEEALAQAHEARMAAVKKARAQGVLPGVLPGSSWGAWTDHGE